MQLLLKLTDNYSRMKKIKQLLYLAKVVLVKQKMQNFV